MADYAFFKTLLSVFLGALLAGIVNFISEGRKKRQQERIAVMVVATNLRHWIGRVSGRIDETRTHINSEGAGGTLYTQVPEFRFETALEQVSLLDNKTAKKIFDLIYDKDVVNAFIRASFEYQSDDEAVGSFIGQAAKLCLAAAAIHEEMSKTIRWTENVLPNQDKKNLKYEFDSDVKNNERRAASNREFF